MLKYIIRIRKEESEMEKTKYELRDELIDMWCHAMCCVGTSYSDYEELKKQFMVTLGEFEEKVKEECW